MSKQKWANRQPISERSRAILWILLAVLMFLLANAVSGPLVRQEQAVSGMAPTETERITRITATPQPSATIIQPTPTKTPLPPEYLENYDDTNGVVVGTIMLVVIILLGTISGIRLRRSQE